MKLLTTNNAKTVKGEKKGYKTAVLYLAPHKLSGRNVCPSASAGCIAACLNTAGHGAFSSVQKARIAKTQWLTKDRAGFVEQLKKDIVAFKKHCEKNNLKPCIRLNGTSDLNFDSPVFGIMQAFPEITFYDYSAIEKKATAWAQGKLPKNYHVTFSRKENNQEACERVAKAGGNIAVVFSSKENQPKEYLGLPVVNGDETDLRFLDPKGVVVGLYSKGKGRRDASGFVVQV